MLYFVCMCVRTCALRQGRMLGVLICLSLLIPLKQGFPEPGARQVVSKPQPSFHPLPVLGLQVGSCTARLLM